MLAAHYWPWKVWYSGGTQAVQLLAMFPSAENTDSKECRNQRYTDLKKRESEDYPSEQQKGDRKESLGNET